MKLYISLMFVVVVSFINSNVYAQQKIDNTENLYNIYYLSKYITIPNLDTSSKKQVYNALIGNLGAKKLANSSLAQNFYLRRLISDVEKSEIKKISGLITNGNFLKIQQNELKTAVQADAKKIATDIENLLKNIDSLSLMKSARERNLIENNEFITQFQYIIQSLEDPQPKTESITQLNQIIIRLLAKHQKGLIDSSYFFSETARLDKLIHNDSIINKNDSIKTIVEPLKKKLILTNEKLRIFIESDEESTAIFGKQIGILESSRHSKIDSLAKLIFKHNSEDNLVLNSSAFLNNMTIEQTIAQISVNSQVNNAEQRSGSSLKLPSESDLINAMAMFLANRAKQEAMIWFMDRLKEQIHNPLLLDAFPQTYKLLQESNGYLSTDFGNAWRRSLAEDYLYMPSNLVKSTWVQEKWFSRENNNSRELEELVTMGNELIRLVHAQYSYRDILRHLYLKRPKEANVSKLKSSIDFLYMAINEFYTIDKTDGKSSMRLLTYEDLSTLNDAQWSVFLELIKVKYSQDVGSIIENSFATLSDKSDMRGKWISSLLLTLSQFDKIGKNTNHDATASLDIWSLLAQVIHQVDPENYIDYLSTSGNPIKPAAYIVAFQKVIETYAHVHNKNFDLATKAIIDLMQGYVLQGTKKITVSNKGELRLETAWNNGASISLKKYFQSVDTTVTITSDGKKLIFNGQEEHSFIIANLVEDTKLLKYSPKTFSKENWSSWTSTHFSKQSETYRLILHMKNCMGLSGENNYENYLLVKLLLDILESPEQIKLNPAYQIFDTKNLTSLASNENLQQLVYYSSFFSDVLTSTDAQSLSVVINKYVLPPTSYITKRKSNFSLALNAYVGVMGGLQKVLSDDSQFKISTNSTNAIYGLTAPIGLTISKQNMGLFIQAVDLGNLVGHYLWPTKSDANRENVYFKEIISPGLNYMYYIPRSPLVAFIGIKWIPLEETKGPNNTLLNTRSLDLFQMAAGFKFDIPFFYIVK